MLVCTQVSACLHLVQTLNNSSGHAKQDEATIVKLFIESPLVALKGLSDLHLG